MAYNILVVDDDPASCGIVQEAMHGKEFRVSIAETGEEALNRIHQNPPHLVIIDIGLPGMSGFELCELIKRNPQTASLPVIMLTNKDRISDKVEGLNTGADDYITKPFSAKELIARIQALMRRVENQGSMKPILELSGIRIDLQARQATIKGKSVDLPGKEFELLVLFLKKPNQVLSRTFLRETVWGDEVVIGGHTIESRISRLREKLGDLGKKIEVVTGIGYRFSAD